MDHQKTMRERSAQENGDVGGASSLLVDSFFSNEGKGSDKWEQYLAIYARELHRYLVDGQRVDLLEIGVQNGGSLEMWSKVLPPGSGITGIDIDPKVGDLVFQDRDTRAFVLDGTDAAALDRRFDGWTFDVVIDDGSHVCADVLASFAALWKRVRPGGLYIVEDLHTSYHASHGGGLREPGTSIEFFKRVADLVNADHIEGFVGTLDGHLHDLAQTVASITFYDSVVVVQRALKRRERPFRRLLSGAEFEVADNLSRMAVQPRAVLDSLILSEGVGARLSGALTARLEAAERTAERTASEAASERVRAQARIVEVEAERSEAVRLLAEGEARWSDTIAALHAEAARAATAAAAEAAEAAARYRRSLGEAEGRVAERDGRLVSEAAAASLALEAARRDVAAARSEAAEAAARSDELGKRLHRLSGIEDSLRAELSSEKARVAELQLRLDVRVGEIMACLTLIDGVEPAPHDPIVRRVGRLVDSRRAALRAVPDLIEVMRMFRFRSAVLEASIEHQREKNLAFRELLDDAAATMNAVSASRSFIPAKAWARLRRRPNPLRRAVVGQAMFLEGEGRRPFSIEALAARSIPDVGFYADMNPDLSLSERELLSHFFSYGAAEGRPAHPDFDAGHYKASNADVDEAGVPALIHYVLSGAEEDRPLRSGANPEQSLAAIAVRLSGILPGEGAVDPVLGVDEALQLTRSGGPGEREEGESARHGMDLFLDEVLAFAGKLPSQGRSGVDRGFGPTTRADRSLIGASGLVDAAWYAARNGDVGGEDAAFAHFCDAGRAEGRAPNAFFDPTWYAAQDHGVGGPAAAFVHYLRFGQAEGRRPSPHFDPVWYAAQLSKEGVSVEGALRFHLEVGRDRGFATEGARHIASVLETANGDVRSARSLLRDFGHQWGTLPVQMDEGGLRTVTVITDSVDAHSLFGGVGTSLVFGVLMAKRLGASFRLVTRTTPPKAEALGEVLGAHGIVWDGPTEFAYVPVDGEASMFLGPLDTVVTTSWWTTAAALASVPAQQIVYLLQEDERMFYPFGDTRLRCEEVLARGDIRVVINSSLLAEHLFGPGGVPGLSDRSVSFEPAFPAAPRSPDPERPDGKLNFFFYARPNHARNVYWRGLEVIERAVVEGIFDPADWNFVFAGSALPEMTIAGVEPRIIAKLPWRDYAALTGRIDLGLCLMDTPHPSYPPIDLAAAGAVVVTNRHGNKATLRDWSPNIIASDIGVDDLLDALRRGVALARDGETRRANRARGHIPRDWSYQFDGVFDALFPEVH